MARFSDYLDSSYLPGEVYNSGLSEYREDPQFIVDYLTKKKFKFEIGFSDHTKDFLAPIIASSLGVNIIEKHITLSNKMKGPDHSSSMEVKQLPKLIKVLKDSKIALNGSKKKTLIKEEVTKKISRKSIFAISRIKRGEFFSKKNIAILRPGTGIEPKNYFNLIGKKSKKNYFLYESIKK